MSEKSSWFFLCFGYLVHETNAVSFINLQYSINQRYLIQILAKLGLLDPVECKRHLLPKFERILH